MGVSGMTELQTMREIAKLAQNSWGPERAGKSVFGNTPNTALGYFTTTFSPTTVLGLISRLEEAERRIQTALDVPHGGFGPWDDDLCSYEQIYEALAGDQK